MTTTKYSNKNIINIMNIDHKKCSITKKEEKK